MPEDHPRVTKEELAEIRSTEGVLQSVKVEKEIPKEPWYSFFLSSDIRYGYDSIFLLPIYQFFNINLDTKILARCIPFSIIFPLVSWDDSLARSLHHIAARGEAI